MLLDNKHRDEITYKKLITHNAVAPSFYRLPKFHKALPTKFRPICSCINSPRYKCYKLL